MNEYIYTFYTVDNSEDAIVEYRHESQGALTQRRESGRIINEVFLPFTIDIEKIKKVIYNDELLYKKENNNKIIITSLKDSNTNHKTTTYLYKFVI